MAVMPTNVSRAPSLLSSQLILSNLTRANLDLFNVQQQLSSGQQVSRPSDDPVAAAMIAAIRERLGQADQRTRNLTHAGTLLGTLDSTLTEATDLVRQAQTIALSQVGMNSDPVTRTQQAAVIDSLVLQLKSVANRKVAGTYLFGGSTATQQPLMDLMGGYRYTAGPGSMLTDLGTGDPIALTMGGGNAIGETSGRLSAGVPLNPNLTLGTQVSDVRGGRGLGVALGSIQFTVNGGGPASTVDLAGAKSIGDVANLLTRAVRDYEAANSVTVLGPGGVGVSGTSLNFDMSAGATLDFGETANGVTAADLGLLGATFSTGSTLGAALDPKLTMGTRLADIPGLPAPLGMIRLKLTQPSGTGGTAQNVTRDVDLSGAVTVDDVRSLIESAGVGARLRINQDGRSLDLFGEVSGPSLSVEEVVGNASTAALLGIRTMQWQTPVSDFNDGRGVRIVDGSSDPVTGLPDPARDRDFRITLGNGQSFDVDLRPGDLVNVQSLISRINQQFNDAIAQPPINTSAPPLAGGQFIAQLTDGPNGIALTQTVGGAPLSVSKLNNSAAAEDLGLLAGAWDAPTSTLIAQDRAAVRVDNLFTDLMDLAAALRRNDNAGIGLAGERMTAAADRLSTAQALVGSSSQRVEQASRSLDEQKTLDEALRSQLQDTDYFAAASRFSLLQTQLQASLQTAGQIAQRQTLLDFLT